MALDLCTLDDLKGYLEGLANVNKYDTLLAAIITMTSKRFGSYCEREWDNNSGNDITEYFDGTGQDFIIVKHVPIASVTSLYDDANRSYGADTLIDATDYVFYADRGIIQLDGSTFGKGLKNIKAVYKGGYTASTIPDDLRMACLLESAKTFEMRKRLGLDSKSAQGGSVMVTPKSMVTPLDFLAEVKAIIDMYRLYLVAT